MSCMYDNDVFFLRITIDFTDKHCIVTTDSLVSALYNRLFRSSAVLFSTNAHVEISFDYHPPSAAALLPENLRMLTVFDSGVLRFTIVLQLYTSCLG